MQPDAVATKLQVANSNSLDEGHTLFDIVAANKLNPVLVVALREPIAAAYIAGALAETSSGTLTLVQNTAARGMLLNRELLQGIIGCEGVEDIYFKPGDLSPVLMSLLARYKHGHFSFCYLSGCRSWTETLNLLCVAEKLLKPGGWLGLNSLYCAPRGSDNQPTETIVSDVNNAYTLLVEGSFGFSSFYRAAGRAFARKLECLETLRSVPGHEVDLVVCKALEIAYSDPEFRAELMQAPVETLSALSGKDQSGFAGIRFRESGIRAPLQADPSAREGAPIGIERPSWQWAADESFLERFLRERGQG